VSGSPFGYWGPCFLGARLGPFCFFRCPSSFLLAFSCRLGALLIYAVALACGALRLLASVSGDALVLFLLSRGRPVVPCLVFGGLSGLLLASLRGRSRGAVFTASGLCVGLSVLVASGACWPCGGLRPSPGRSNCSGGFVPVAGVPRGTGFRGRSSLRWCFAQPWGLEHGPPWFWWLFDGSNLRLLVDNLCKGGQQIYPKSVYTG